MTIATTDRLVIYRGNGIATDFPFNFPIPTGTLSVALQDYETSVITEVLTPGDYSVIGLDDPAGGTVTYDPPGGPLEDDFNIIILRTLPYTQELNISPYGGFDPTVVEQQLDNIVMQIQQIAELQSRSLIVNPGQTPPDLAQILAAEGYATQAETARDAAQTAATNAGDSADLAEAWATNPEDVEVEPGLFSAYHWYRKTLALYQSVVDGFAAAIHGATLKAAMIDADEFGYWDSVSETLRKLTLANLVTSIFKTGRTIANAEFAAATFKLFNAAGTPRALTFDTTALTADRAATWPNKAGTVAFLDDNRVKGVAYTNAAGTLQHSSGDISSCTKIGTGQYRYTLSTAMPDTNYPVFVGVGPGNSTAVQGGKEDSGFTKTTTQFQILITNSSGPAAFDSVHGVTVLR